MTHRQQTNAKMDLVTPIVAWTQLIKYLDFFETSSATHCIRIDDIPTSTTPLSDSGGINQVIEPIVTKYNIECRQI